MTERSAFVYRTANTRSPAMAVASVFRSPYRAGANLVGRAEGLMASGASAVRKNSADEDYQDDAPLARIGRGERLAHRPGKESTDAKGEERIEGVEIPTWSWWPSRLGLAMWPPPSRRSVVRMGSAHQALMALSGGMTAENAMSARQRTAASLYWYFSNVDT